MIIANPIYDVVFKKLMEDERVAKFFISTLTNQIIEEIQLKPQEFTYHDQLIGLAVYRVDYIATIKTESGEYKKVLIEIQKAKNVIDLMRFRNYLAEQYKKEDEIDTISGKIKTALPIVTIYLLGFSLPEIETSTLHVKRNYFDLINNRIIESKSEFVEKLTHDSYIVQLQRIEHKYQTRLDKMLSVFEQSDFVDDSKIIKKYNHQVDEANVKNMTDILHRIGTEPEEKKQIEDEREAWRTFDALTGGIKEKLEIQIRVAEEQKKEIEKNKKELDENKREMENQAKLIEELKSKLSERE